MTPSYDFKVLDAIGNSLLGHFYTIGHLDRSQEIYGITWQTLEEIAGVPGDDIRRAVATLIERGLVRQGGPFRSPVRRLLGRRRLPFLWVTHDGRRVLEMAAQEAE